MVVVLTVCIHDVFVDIIKRVHLIMGACPCGHAPRPCTCVQAPKNSNSPSEHCNYATVAVDCTLNHQTNVVTHNGRVNDLVQTQERQAATVGARLSPPRLHSRNVDHLISVLQLKKLHGKPRESASPVSAGQCNAPQKAENLHKISTLVRPGSNISIGDTTPVNLNPGPTQETKKTRKRGQIKISPDIYLALLLPTPLIPNKAGQGQNRPDHYD